MTTSATALGPPGDAIDTGGASAASPAIDAPLAPDTVVATVAGRPIRLRDVEAREDALRRGPRGRHLPPAASPAGAEARRWIVRELVTEALIRHALDERGLPSADALVEAVASGPAPSEAEIADYYRRNADRFRLDERALVRLAPATGGGVDDDLAAAPETEVRRGELAGPFEDALLAAAPGTVVGPFIVAGRPWLARLKRVLPAGLRPLEEVRAGIEAELRAADRARRFEDWLERQRAALVRLEPGFEHPGDPTRRTPSHRH